jgi:glycosyltransferase involved in cell wall biosynthesis
VRRPGTIAFVIPVYRNERAVTLTYEKLTALFAAPSGPLSAWAYTMVFVDDGSDDGSLAELKAIRARDERVKVISFTRNFGQMAAMLAGFKQAVGDVVLNLSADLQDPVDLIPKMIDAWHNGGEVVIAYRANREDTWTSRLASRLFYGIVRMSYPQIPPGGFDYILLDRTVMDAFNGIDVRNRFFQGDILWFGYRTTFIPYTRQRRTIGRSQYTFAKKLKNSLDAILDSSYLPIRFISAVGAVTALLGFLYAIDIVYARWMHQIPVTGWAPIMILLLIIGGLIMLMLGVIGEYIWRIYDEVRGKPNYVIREIQ